MAGLESVDESVETKMPTETSEKTTKKMTGECKTLGDYRTDERVDLLGGVSSERGFREKKTLTLHWEEQI